MFSKSNNDVTPQSAQEKSKMTKSFGTSGAPSIIGSDIKISGNLSTPGEIQLDGVIDGDISCGALTMGEHGQVVGTISADSVVIRGKVEGTIRARTVRLEKSSKVTGDINHETVSVEAGAFIEGKFIHADGSSGSAKAASPAKEKAPSGSKTSETSKAAESEGGNGSGSGSGSGSGNQGASGRRESLIGS